MNGSSRPRILLAHCRYRARGGEDVVFEAERDLLRDRGHDVATYTRDNADLEVASLSGKARAAVETMWAHAAVAELSELIAGFRPDVVHAHNLFMRLSPGVYHACRRAGVPIVQTLHNYRFGCAAATLWRDGGPCQDCVGRRFGWPGVVHACYHGSRMQSAVIAATNTLHRSAGTWDVIDRYVATSDFARQRLAAIGVPANRIVVKPHFVTPDPGARDSDGAFLLFVGRLTQDKGVPTLLAAAERTGLPVRMVGDGPLADDIVDRAPANVELLGAKPRGEVLDLMGAARAVVVPSVWYETFGLVVIEAYACATPVIASDIGALSEIVDSETGVLVPPGDAAGLAAAMDEAWADAVTARERGRAARRRFEQRYTAGVGYELLSLLYDDVVGARGRAGELGR